MTEADALLTVSEISSGDYTIGYIVDKYSEFICNFSARPDISAFPIVKEGDILDEEKSVRWNREEVARLISERAAESRRLAAVESSIFGFYEDAIVAALADDYSYVLSVQEARILWNYFRREHESDGPHAVLSHLEDFLDTYAGLKKVFMEERGNENNK